MNEPQKKNLKKTFFLTSARLAGRLLHAGYELQDTTNPFNPNHWRAWEVTLDSNSAKVIKEFYDENQLRVPYAIIRWLDNPEPEVNPEVEPEKDPGENPIPDNIHDEDIKDEEV